MDYFWSKRIAPLVLILITVYLATNASCKPTPHELTSDGGIVHYGASYPFAYPVGPATGDLDGSYPNPIVAGLQGNPVPPPGGNFTDLQYALNIDAGVDGGDAGLTWAPTAITGYGDGSDGAAVFDGTATPAGTTKASSTYTLNRDVYYSSVTISSGVVLEAASAPYGGSGVGFRIFCQGRFINVGSVIADGQAASGATAGKGFAFASGTSSSGTLGWGRNGGAGSINNGAAGSSPSTAYGGSGGAGGAGGTGTAGAAGTASAPTSGQTTVPRSSSDTGTVYDSTSGSPLALPYNGGAGGGGGGGDGTNSGGGGGGGAGVLWIAALEIKGNGTFTANGGAGAAGVGGNAGGGGGGGGGVVHIVSRRSTIATDGGTISANAGLGGAAHGSGAVGTAGSAGQVVQLYD